MFKLAKLNRKNGTTQYSITFYPDNRLRAYRILMEEHEFEMLVKESVDMLDRKIVKKDKQEWTNN